MGRVEKRKQAKKNNEKVNEINIERSASDIIKSLVKIVIGVSILLGILYLVLAVFVTKEFDSNKSTDSTSSSENEVSNKILAKNIFNQSPEEYYVYFYDFNNDDSDISNKLSSISGDLYKVDTSSGLNSNYVSDTETGNENAVDLNDLKVINPTLIKVSNDKIVEYIQSKNNIINYINNLG